MHEGTDGYTQLSLGNEGTCFGCGLGNASGLHMKFHTDGKRVVSQLAVPGHLCGWGNLVHGGISATILDEVMGWTAIYQLKMFVLTKSMSIRYLKPVFAGEQIRVEGSIVEKISEREAVVKADLYKYTGELSVCATGNFALYAPEGAKRLGFVDEKIIEEFTGKFLL